MSARKIIKLTEPPTGDWGMSLLKEKLDALPEHYSAYKLYVSFKVKKRRKIKRIHIMQLEYKTFCECCGPELRYHIKMGGRDYC